MDGGNLTFAQLVSDESHTTLVQILQKPAHLASVHYLLKLLLLVACLFVVRKHTHAKCDCPHLHMCLDRPPDLRNGDGTCMRHKYARMSICYVLHPLPKSISKERYKGVSGKAAYAVKKSELVHIK
jgi:hypothetical protein